MKRKRSSSPRGNPHEDEELDPSSQAALDEEAKQYDEERYPPLIAMGEAAVSQVDPPPMGRHTLAGQLKELQDLISILTIEVGALKGTKSRGGTCTPTQFAGLDLPPWRPPEIAMWEPPLFDLRPPPCSSAPLPPPPPGEIISPLEAVIQAAKSKGEDTQGFMAFLVVEMPDPNNPGAMLREWRPFPFKQLKELKEACNKYGPTAPFTLTILETMATDALPAGDWKSLAHACLSAGDYLLWKS